MAKRPPKPFQEATVKAIIEHFKNHDRALCADEAGLGKTIVAAEVIRRMAEEKVVTDDIKKLETFWKALWEALRKKEIEFSQNSIGGPKYSRYKALKTFYNTVLGEECKDQLSERGTYNNVKWMETVENDIMKRLGLELERAKTAPNREFIIRFLTALAQLDFDSRTTNNGRTYMDNNWGLPFPKDILPAPYRVLYICNSLALADQNTKRLVTVPQRSIRSSTDKPDRLSTLWYYLQFQTPFLEIYPITATVTKTETPGTQKEWKLLRIPKNSPDSKKSKARQAGEQKSINEFSPDLVIFDEFQKFTDIVNLIKMDAEAFNAYLDSIRSAPNDSEDDGENTNDPSEKNNRIEALKRCRKICEGLFNKQERPKVLMLSATPFHSLEGTEKITEIDIESLVEFMGGNQDDYRKAVEKNDIGEVQRILYDECGIFRTERVRLMQKEHHAYHIIRCSDEGVFSRALSVTPNQNYYEETGRRASGISMNVPDLCAVNKSYQSKYHVRENVSELGKYKRLREIILAPAAEDILENGCRLDLSGTGDLNQLLWIPPVDPSAPLKGIFEKYRYFSKTIIFSNLIAIPASIAISVNGEMKVTPVTGWDEKTEEDIEKGLKELLGYDEWAKFAMKYLKAVGGNVLNGKTVEKVLQYCEDGCLADVMREWAEGDDFPDQLMEKADLGNFRSVACCVEEKDLNDNGISKRTCFNSPFYPFVLATTSIGAEGLDYHTYCNRMVHYTRPKNVIELEQKNGRIDRYHSLAQRRNLAKHGDSFAASERLEELMQLSGGMIPDWDPGEGGIYYYFLCTEHTSDLNKLQDLFEQQKEYRRRLGMPNAAEPDSLILSPFLN